MAIPSFDMVDNLIQSLGTVSYSDVKKGQEALARVAMQPGKKEALRAALAIMGDQLNLPLVVRQAAPMVQAGGGGAMIPPSGPPVGTAMAAPMNNPQFNQAQGALVRRVAPQVARFIDQGMSPEQAVRAVRGGSMGSTLKNLGEAFRRAGFTHPVAGAQTLRNVSGTIRGAQRALPAAQQIGQIAAGAGGAGAAAAAAAEAAGLGGMGATLAAAAPALAPLLLTAGLTAKAISELAATQDPMEQLRYAASPRAKNRTLAVRDLDMNHINNTYDYTQLKTLVEEGVIDQSVLDAYRAPGDERIPDYVPPGEAPAARDKIFPEDIEINAERPKVGGGSTGNLMMGARGERVAEVQKKLSTLGTMTPGVSFDLGSTGADGVFGGKTKAAVEDFQRMSGIRVDGIVGPETQAALDKAMGAAVGAKEAEMAAKADVDAPQLGAGVTPTDEDPRPDSIVRALKTSPVRFDVGEFSDESIDAVVGDPIDPSKIASDRDAPTQNTQAYLDLGLDEEVRRSPFPMFRRRRNRN
jgi:peptidoglycan hydrolase-like protein with peptidoglycan-binding domain